MDDVYRHLYLHSTLLDLNEGNSESSWSRMKIYIPLF